MANLLSRLGSGIFWFWPSIILGIFILLSFAMPGGPEVLVVAALVAIQLLLIGGRLLYRLASWVIAEANARSAQT